MLNEIRAASRELKTVVLSLEARLHHVTITDLQETECRIMKTVADVVKQFQTSVDKLSAAQVEFKIDLQKVADNDTSVLAKLVDVQNQLAAINAGSGTVTEADQPAIDKLQSSLDQVVSDATAANAATLALVPALPPAPEVPPVA